MYPKKIIVMRHAESQEDVDKTVYAYTSDLDISLSPYGEIQSVNMSPKLASRIEGSHVHFYISPGLRLRQTYNLMTAHFPKALGSTFTVELLIMKQFWGDVTVKNRREIEIARYREGVLIYRFPNGESGPQLVARFKLFVENLRKDFQREDFPENIVILTHGFEMRVFLMVWFGWSTSYFESLANPRNCEMVTLSLQVDGSYKLEDTLRMYDSASNPNHVARK
ncbi:phosphoglycerate mutase family protein [Candidatus Nomurabacteria bacterium]|nr:phosphoglycerate mutase family protein [Candidatus Nomurabacteria bacterium]